SGGAERSGAGPVAAGAPPNGIGGRERAWLVVAAPDRRSSESVAHGTTRRPPIPFGSPPSAPPAPERPALLKDNGCDNLEEMKEPDEPRGDSLRAGTGEGAGGTVLGGTPMRS